MLCRPVLVWAGQIGSLSGAVGPAGAPVGWEDQDPGGVAQDVGSGAGVAYCVPGWPEYCCGVK